MRKIALLLAAGAALATAPALQARDRPSGEQRLAEMLEGRVAGEPVNCISLFRARNAKVIDKTAIVYDAGSVIYVNRPSHANSLDSDEILVTQPHGSQLCKLDTVRLHDRSSHFFSGFVGLEEFVPYRKVAMND